MIQVHIIRATNLPTVSNFTKISVNVYANKYTKTRFGKTKKSKIKNPIFDLDKEKPFYIPFLNVGTIEFEAVYKSKFKHKMIIGSGYVPLSLIGEECNFEIPITSTSHINNDAKLSVVIIFNHINFDFISHFMPQSKSKENMPIPLSEWKSPLYLFVSPPSNSSFELQKTINLKINLSFLRFHQLGRYPSIIDKSSSKSFSGIRLPFQENKFHINMQTTEVFEINPELLSPFYYTPIINSTGFRGTLVFNIVSNFSKKFDKDFDYKIIKQSSIEVENDGYYSSGLIFWPKQIGRISFITNKSRFLGEENLNCIDNTDQIVAQISPSLKSSYKNGPLTQEARRRFYQAEEESYSFSLENISDFTLTLFPPYFNISIENVRANNRVFINYYLLDSSYKSVNFDGNSIKKKNDNSLSIKLFEIPNDVNYIIICSNANSKVNNQAKLAITDLDNKKEIANSTTFLMQSSYTKIIFILYRISDDRWSSIEGEDWVSIKNESKVESKVTKLATSKLALADKRVKDIKKLVLDYNDA